jgi:gamma-glutamyl-gamma-aminobutyrate hydrolase PuuD
VPAPDSTADEVRASVLRYLRAYEEGKMTLGDLAADLAVMAPAYDDVMGGIADSYGELLAAGYRFHAEAERNPSAPSEELERVLTEFRRAEAAW